MSDAALKRCEDFAKYQIELGSDNHGVHLGREGRRIATYQSWNEAGLAAEILYEKIRQIRMQDDVNELDGAAD